MKNLENWWTESKCVAVIKGLLIGYFVLAGIIVLMSLLK